MELMGVFDETLVEPLAQVMAKLGVDRGMVVYGQDSLDEISICAPTSVCEIRDGWFQSYELTPEQFGYERVDKDALKGGTPEGKRCHNRVDTEGCGKRSKTSGCMPQCGSGSLYNRTGGDYGRRREAGRAADRRWFGAEKA